MLMEVGSPDKKMIKDLKAREILDSRGNPTVEVSLLTNEGRFVSSVPSGASTGSHEAKELRDNDSARFNGKGVLKAVQNINTKIKDAIVGKQADLLKIDEILLNLDNSEDKSNLGANAILPVSMAVCRAEAFKEKKEVFSYISSRFNFNRKIPVPCFNVVNGGAHSGGGVDFQEFMIVPREDSFANNLRYGVEYFFGLKKRVGDLFGKDSLNIGDEGGIVPKIKTERDVLEVLTAVDEKVNVLVDVAATEFYRNERYNFNGEEASREEMIDFYAKLADKYPILGFEDPLCEDDFEGWSNLKKKITEKLLVGDDLLVTNTKRMQKAKDSDSCNAMILKINQIGSITEAVSAAKMAQSFNWKIIVSHRSGETNDDFIADFAVGIGADYIKSGAPQRGERVAKYNRLLEIEGIS